MTTRIERRETDTRPEVLLGSRDRNGGRSGGGGALLASALLLLSLLPARPGSALSFEERVDAQTVIERFRYERRIWPKENEGAKPPFEASVPRSVIVGKVEATIRKAIALERFWNAPIRPEQLQGELDRMARSTRDPEALGRLFAALGNDPELIAETLARETLADRLGRERYSRDEGIHAATRGEAERLRATADPDTLPRVAGERWQPIRLRGRAETDPGDLSIVSCADFERTERLFPPAGALSEVEESDEAFAIRLTHSRSDGELSGGVALFPKRPFEEWLLENVPEVPALAAPLPDRPYSLPSITATTPSSPDSWQYLWWNPRGRFGHTAVWTGEEMIIWGGDRDGEYLGDGARYDPLTNSWSELSGFQAPSRRYFHSAVWTGEEMVIFGGWGCTNSPTCSTNGYLGDGASWNSSRGRWTALPSSGAPSARYYASMIWTGSRLIVWGGQGAIGFLATGASWTPNQTSWQSLPTTGAPSPRRLHATVWTGQEMVVWGGYGCTNPPLCSTNGYLADGARLSADGSSWKALAAAPLSGRHQTAATWTGERMFVWGGNATTTPNYKSDGASWDPVTNGWTALGAAGSPPTGRSRASATWNGEEVVVWGGYSGSALGNGARYSPSTGTWTSISSTGAPSARFYHSAVWAGDQVIVWGGTNGTDFFGNGGRYSIDGAGTEHWTAVTEAGLPTERSGHLSIWDGDEMIVWGGKDKAGSWLTSGSRYAPATDSWSAMANGLSGDRTGSRAAWTGDWMIVWGGLASDGTYRGTGSRYNPAANSWSAMTTSSGPSGRNGSAIAWSGSRLLVWGGYGCLGLVVGDCTGPTLGFLGNGFQYSPGTPMSPTDRWYGMSATGAPTARADSVGIWYPSESSFFVWGGRGNSGDTDGEYKDSGALFDGRVNSWSSPVSHGTSPSRRAFANAARFGDSVSRVIISGGRDGSGWLADGKLWSFDSSLLGLGQYWTTPSSANQPTSRSETTMTSTGHDAVVWGGFANGSSASPLADGASLGPPAGHQTPAWTPLPEVDTTYLSARGKHSAVWTGEEIYYWDGDPETAMGAIFVPNTPPRAVASASSPTFLLDSGGSITLSDAGSTDGSNPETTTPYHDKRDSIALFRWDLDNDTDCGTNDGSWEATGSTTVVDQLTLQKYDLARPGRLFFTLGIVDEAGAAGAGCTFVDILDGNPPTVELLAPNGVESWAYSPSAAERKSHLISWTPADDFRLGRTKLSWSADGGASWDCLADSGLSYFSPHGVSPIPDLGSVSKSFTVTSTATVRDVELRIDIDHPRNADLSITLCHGAICAILVDEIGGTGEDFTSTVFDDEATSWIVEGTTPFTGVFKPMSSFTVFDGASANGTWTVTVEDKVEGEAGSFLDFTLVLGTDAACGNRSNGASSHLEPGSSSYLWQMPTESEAAALGQILPSATAQVKVELFDESNNGATDTSDANFYLIQPTTTAVRTMILWDSVRFAARFNAAAASAMALKLQELADHEKVVGVVRDLASAGAVQVAYGLWDALPGSATRANDVAEAISSYLYNGVDGQISTAYTNCEFVILVGDDQQIPFHRIFDGAATYPESVYPTEPGIGLNTSTTIGAAIAAGYFASDNLYGETNPEPSTLPSPHDWIWLNDLAVGRLVETPDQITNVINAFLAHEGQVDLLDSDERVLVTGFDFLWDSALSIKQTFVGGGEPVDCLLDDPDSGGTTNPCLDRPYSPADLEGALFSSPPHSLVNVNTHANHFSWATSTGGLSTTAMDANPAPLTGTIVVSTGCHSGLPVPSGSNSLDLPEVMAKKGVLAYVGNTGYGWGIRNGIGYSEQLMELLATELSDSESVSMGRALADAKRSYRLRTWRWDVFDEKVVHEMTLFGIPNTLVVTNLASRAAKESPRKEKEVLPLPDAPVDSACADGICMTKSLLQGGADAVSSLPSGVTELDLSFSFASTTYQQVTTPDGSYFQLNGQSSAEAGDAVQPHFVYDSRLSGTAGHGVIFTGGSYSLYPATGSWDPVVAVPRSTNYDLGEGQEPRIRAMTPAVNVSWGAQATRAPKGVGTDSLGQMGYTHLTVRTGYFDADLGKAARFDSTAFTIYYSNRIDDVTGPTIPDPGTGRYDTVTGLDVAFSVPVSDSSGVYRVLVTWNEHRTHIWRSLDLVWNPGTARWEGQLSITGDVSYLLQAVDNAGNVGILSTGGPDLDGDGEPYGSVWSGPRIFDITLANGDSDVMPDVYELAHPCLDRFLADGSGDPDEDLRTSEQEFFGGTDPCRGDSDGGGDNDGSEVSNGRNPLAKGDDRLLTIAFNQVGSNYQLSWGDGLGQNASIDGPYFIYRSAVPFFGPTERVNATAIPNGTTAYNDNTPPCNPCFYRIWNAPLTTPAPTVSAVVPAIGAPNVATPIEIYGKNFVAEATVSICDVPATNVVFVTSNLITATTPALPAGGCTVKVRNPNGQEGSLPNGYRFQ
jgi:subtilisin-like proprotein convertase family protein/N-acetylneuraminic acid mutarotase